VKVNSLTSRYSRKARGLHRNYTNTEQKTTFKPAQNRDKLTQKNNMSTQSFHHDISDLALHSAPRFQSSLKSYGEMVLRRDPSHTNDVTPMSPLMSPTSSKMQHLWSPRGGVACVTAAGTPFVFNDFKNLK
jgi:hypothetical protein